jgi:hypothetical protein
MTRIINVPKKGSKHEITCQPMHGGFEFYGENGSTLCHIVSATPEGMARQLADLLTRIRDIGFEHGREYVRDALGVQSCKS